jgi:hypothetical protein
MWVLIAILIVLEQAVRNARPMGASNVPASGATVGLARVPSVDDAVTTGFTPPTKGRQPHGRPTMRESRRVSSRPCTGRAFGRAIPPQDAGPNGRNGAGFGPRLGRAAPLGGRAPLASYFVPTMHRARPGTRILPSFSNALTFAMACARIRSRAGPSTC